MAWIESHQMVYSHPKTKRLCRLLQISRAQAIGHLHILWWWALDFAQEGNLDRYSDDDIADAGDWTGDAKIFVDALIEAGYIDIKDGSRLIHDWRDYAGKLIERRKIDSERKQRLRAKDEIPMDVQWMSNGQIMESISNSNSNQYLKDKDQRSKDIPPSDDEGECETNENGGAQSQTGIGADTKVEPLAEKPKKQEYSADFDTFWSHYPRKVDKKASWTKWKARINANETPERLIQSAINYASYCKYHQTGERFIQHASTFLGPDERYKRFVDEVPIETLKSPPEPKGFAALREASAQLKTGGLFLEGS